MTDHEKASHAYVEKDEYAIKQVPTVEAFPESARAEAGVVLDIEGTSQTGLQLAKDGHTVLLPQPTKDPNDPLNWSWTKKHLMLFTVAWGSLCADYTSASGTATLFLQGAQWEKSPNVINYAGNLNVLMMGIGGLIWVPMVSYFGRAPVLFWTTVLGFIFNILAAVSTEFNEFYAMRALTGLFITAAQTISIAFLKDLFFFHERARKIGLWAVIYIASPYLGPCLSNFVAGGTGVWQDVFWVDCGVVGLQLLFILSFIDETYYNRDLPHGEQPARPQGLLGRLGRIIGVWQIQNHHRYYYTFVESYRRFIAVILKPAFTLICLQYLFIFAWAIGINITGSIIFETPTAYGGYGFTSRSLGFMYFTPIVGIIIGEIFGHFFNDALAHRYIKRHHGIFEPEARLPTIYVGCIPQIAGLVLLGQAFHRHLPIVAAIFGWGMMSFGVVVNSVAVTAYALDAYPTTPAEVAGWINFSRVIGGFSVGYFQTAWGAKVGYDASFGTQAAIVAASLIFVVVLQLCGHSLRLKAGRIP